MQGNSCYVGKEIHLSSIADIVGHKGKEEGDDGNDDGQLILAVFGSFGWSAFLQASHFLIAKV